MLDPDFGFQFHSGSIKTFSRVLSRPAKCSFDFHCGSIKTLVGGALALLLMLFQFHSGSIKTGCTPSSAKMFGEFQFHSGSIKTAMRLFRRAPKPSFNSTLVRLRLGREVAVGV